MSETDKSNLILQISEYLADDLRKVDEHINSILESDTALVREVGQYVRSTQGKRLRPILLLVSCRLFRDPTPEAIQLAAVVELIHTATLVHDDVIDEAKTRRGKSSANVVWGNQISVLAGDWLYMQAFQIALRLRRFDILDLLITLTQRMVDGELLQLERLGRIDISEADALELIDHKTASLFAACTKLGGIAGGAGEQELALLSDFGWNLGMAFQIADDILDFTARESVLGKPVGNDLREGKVTLPLCYALDGATAEERAAVEAVLADRAYERASFEQIRAMLERHGGIERARARAREFTSRARLLLEGFPDTPARAALMAATELVADRDR
jgi:octaprenyl-diphosphate synthase